MTAVFNITVGHWSFSKQTRKRPSLALDGHEHVAKPKPKRNFLEICCKLALHRGEYTLQ